MAKTCKNMKQILYFVNTLTLVLAKYNLEKTYDEWIVKTDTLSHNICDIQDLTEENIYKNGHSEWITTIENELGQLRVDLEA